MLLKSKAEDTCKQGEEKKKTDVKSLCFFVVPEDRADIHASIMGAEEVVADEEVDIFDENETFI